MTKRDFFSGYTQTSSGWTESNQCTRSISWEIHQLDIFDGTYHEVLGIISEIDYQVIDLGINESWLDE